ncbi:MAG: hypothetical protein BWY78_00648 [Alphaproteobacteria bacterium ADurb.Bin438]|nr:MAG: hypothetical protein BWY78_00648 [Alphaproteobacteria bacterium ADurb.Bin438]
MFEKLRYLSVLPEFIESVCGELVNINKDLTNYNKDLKEVIDLSVGLGTKTYEKNFLNTKIYNRYYKYIAIGLPPDLISQKLASDFNLSETVIKEIINRDNNWHQAYIRFAKKFAINVLKKNKFKNKEIAKILNMSENSVYRMIKEKDDKDLKKLQSQYEPDFLSRYKLKCYNEIDDE